MSRTFEATLSIGIGDLIMMHAQFEGQKHNYDRLRVSPNWGLLAFRSPEYRPFVQSFFELLFQGPPYEHAFTEDLPLRSIIDLEANGFPYRHPQLANKLCVGEPLASDRPYVVLNTKIRDLPIERWNESKGAIFDALRSLHPRYNIVLTGEREVEYNTEYSHFKEHLIYCIYRELMDNLPVTDLTIPRCGITPPDLNRLRADCAIMRGAAYNITISLGGGLCMALAVGKVVGLRGDCHPALDALYRDAEQPGVFLSYDTPAFLEKVRGLSGG